MNDNVSEFLPELEGAFSNIVPSSTDAAELIKEGAGASVVEQHVADSFAVGHGRLVLHNQGRHYQIH